MKIGMGDLCGELKNYGFNVPTDEIPKFYGTYTIANGAIDLSSIVSAGNLQNGQYFRIIGSAFNDGIYTYPAYLNVSETFTGSIWVLRIPTEVVSLLNEINTWLDKYGESIQSPLQSESIGSYSYSKAAAGAGGNGRAYTWKDQFCTQLARWRKIRSV